MHDQFQRRAKRSGSMPLALAALSILLTALTVSCGAQPAAAKTKSYPTFTCHRPVAHDGDSIRCSTSNRPNAPTIKVRLLGIDAPELGKCRRGRVCVDGDPLVSLNLLSGLLTRAPVTVQDFGPDRYGRTLGIVRVRGENGARDRTNVACPLIYSGSVAYKPHWDKANRIGKECRVKGGA